MKKDFDEQQDNNSTEPEQEITLQCCSECHSHKLLLLYLTRTPKSIIVYTTCDECGLFQSFEIENQINLTFGEDKK